MKEITGLSDKQVEESRNKYGSNKMSEQASERFGKNYWEISMTR